MRFQYIILLAGISTWMSCQSEYLSPTDYIKYIRNEENGFIQRHKVGNLVYEAFYQPPAYVALMQSKPGKIAKASIQNSLAKQSEFYQFMFSIRSVSGLPIDDELEKVSGTTDSIEIKKQHLFYRSEKAYTVLIGKDSVSCVFYHPQLTGKVNNAYQFLLVFESEPATEELTEQRDLKLVFRDSLWFHRKFEFVFNKKSIAAAPKLKL